MFSVVDCVLRWNQDGSFLCARVDFDSKSKKGTSTIVSDLLIFRARARGYPTEMVQIRNKISAFNFEPPVITSANVYHAPRFAVISLPDPDSKFATISFYSIESKAIKLDFQIKEKKAAALWWSPKGDIIVLGDKDSGYVSFFISLFSFI